MEIRTLEQLLKRRNAQFTLWLMIPIFLGWVILQGYLFHREMNEAEKQLGLWQENHLPRVAQSLFLKNEADLKAMVKEKTPEIDSAYFRFYFQIHDKKLQGVVSNNNKESNLHDLNAVTDHKVDYWKGRIIDTTPILLGGKVQGYLKSQVDYRWEKMIKPSLALLVGCLGVFILLKMGVWLWVRMLRRSVVRPVQKLNSDISLRIADLSSLKPVVVSSQEFQSAPQEFLCLVESYNQLVMNIQNLRAQENQFIFGKAKYEIATQVAHDIRSPLAALSLAIENLPPLPDNQSEVFKNVVTRIHGIAEELLNMHKNDPPKPSAGSEGHAKPIASVSTVVQQIVREKLVFFDKHQEINFVVPELPDIKVVAEEEGLKRALSNLIDNAIEAISEKGEIRIKFTETEGRFYLSVKDSGKGIPKEWFKRVWEPGVSFEKPKGNGLGLSYVKSVVESWGGRVALDSAPGKGTVVSLQLEIFKG